MITLIVDSSSQLGCRLIELLEEGTALHQIVLAKTFAEAVGWFTSEHVATVLVDADLEGDRSEDLVLHLKYLKPWVPLLVLDFDPSPLMAKRFKAARADYYLDKHNDFSFLNLILQDLYDKKNHY